MSGFTFSLRTVAGPGSGDADFKPTEGLRGTKVLGFETYKIVLLGVSFSPGMSSFAERK